VNGLYLILPVLLIVFLSFLIVRAAAVLLVLTGMDPQRARFQALSAFTRTGFTTHEAELVVRHPSRRRIITWLMILGNAGIITVMVTATSAFVQSKGAFVGINFGFLVIGLFVIWLVARHKGLGERWERYIGKRFGREPELEEVFCEDLTHLAEGYGVLRVVVPEGSRFAGLSLGQVAAEGGLRVLGIERDDRWLPVPEREQAARAGDSLVVFGRMQKMREMFSGKPAPSKGG
jgi:hypothetical protein